MMSPRDRSRGAPVVPLSSLAPPPSLDQLGPSAGRRRCSCICAAMRTRAGRRLALSDRPVQYPVQRLSKIWDPAQTIRWRGSRALHRRRGAMDPRRGHFFSSWGCGPRSPARVSGAARRPRIDLAVDDGTRMTARLAFRRRPMDRARRASPRPAAVRAPPPGHRRPPIHCGAGANAASIGKWMEARLVRAIRPPNDITGGGASPQPWRRRTPR